MAGKLLVHIGLPKTATTTLQADFFPSLQSGNGVRYLGVRQPRALEQDPVYVGCMLAIKRPETIDHARLLLEDALDTSRCVLWSDEMLTVGNETHPWLEKLERLGRLLDGLDYMIVCSVRDPVEASFSYFVEKNNYYRNKSLTYEQAVAGDEVMAIYQYGRLMDHLDSIFAPERVCFIDFDDITNGRLEHLAALAGMSAGISGSQQQSKSLPNRNARKREAGHVLTGRNVTFAYMLRAVAVRLGLRRLPFWPQLASAIRPAMRRLGQVSLARQRIATPTPATMEKVRAFYASDWGKMQARMQAGTEAGTRA